MKKGKKKTPWEKEFILLYSMSEMNLKQLILDLDEMDGQDLFSRELMFFYKYITMLLLYI